MTYLTEEETEEFLKKECKPGTCSHCRWWYPEEPPERHHIEFINYEGECRRHSPQHLLVDIESKRNRDSGTLGNTANSAIWPDTDYYDFCGDYELRLPIHIS